MLTQLLYCFCVLSALLLLGTFLRGIVPVFRKLFLPASVIGGFIGLLIGPIIWNGGGIPFPREWIAACGIFGIAAVQLLVGIITRQIFVTGGMDLYAPFGYELPMGFSGGHGTAGVVGNFYKGLDLPYWEIAQGVTTTTATFGLIGGMIIGIIAINVAARTGQTAAIASLPVQAILAYIVPILVMVVLGWVITHIFLFTLFKKFFSDCYFERAVSLWGCSTGVFITGLLLLKICDPDFKTPVLNDYSMGFSLTSVTSFILMPITVSMLLSQSFLVNLLFQAGLLAVGMALLLGANYISRRLSPAAGA
jgi:ESS family glutamate:Na+ symporter